MNPGEIVARGHDLYVVLASKDAHAAVAPLALAKRHNRFGHAVPVRAGALGDGFVACEAAKILPGPWQFSGYCLTIRDLEACQQATRRAQADKRVRERYAPLCAFEQAMPRIKRNGGKRVGPKLAV